MPIEEWLDASSEWADTEGWQGEGWYVVDSNGVVAGPFEDEGEGAWWLDKAVRV